MTNCVKMSEIRQPFFSKWYDFETDLDPVNMHMFFENSKGSFDLDFQFDNSTITNLFKEPVVPPGLEADASLDRRTPELMVS